MSWQYSRSSSTHQQDQPQQPQSLCYFSLPRSSSQHSSSSTSSLQSVADLPALCRHPTLFSQPPSNNVYSYSGSDNTMAAAAPTDSTSTNNLAGNAPPLPSPNASEQGQYFAAMRPQQGQHQQQQQHQPSQGQQQQQQGQHQAAGDRGGTQLYLKDFNLVAEAAKRAQMAVVTRDLDEVAL